MFVNDKYYNYHLFFHKILKLDLSEIVSERECPGVLVNAYIKLFLNTQMRFILFYFF